MSSAPRMVFLGFGKYVRADRIYALEPIVGDDRGNGRRTLVWVEGMPEAMVASRTQQTILEEMGAESTGGEPKRVAQAARRPAAALRRRRLSARELLAGSVHDVARALLGCTFLLDGVGGRDRRGRGLLAGRSREPRVPGPDGAERVDVRRRPERSTSTARTASTGASTSPARRRASGAAVLLRALEPTHGLDEMRRRRGDVADALLCAGPGSAHPGARDHERARRLLDRRAAVRARAARRAPVEIAATPRIGITKAVDLPWRYVVRGSRWVSRGPRPASP